MHFQILPVGGSEVPRGVGLSKNPSPPERLRSQVIDANVRAGEVEKPSRSKTQLFELSRMLCNTYCNFGGERKAEVIKTPRFRSKNQLIHKVPPPRHREGLNIGKKNTTPPFFAWRFSRMVFEKGKICTRKKKKNNPHLSIHMSKVPRPPPLLVSSMNPTSFSSLLVEESTSAPLIYLP